MAGADDGVTHVERCAACGCAVNVLRHGDWVRGVDGEYVGEDESRKTGPGLLREIADDMDELRRDPAERVLLICQTSDGLCIFDGLGDNAAETVGILESVKLRMLAPDGQGADDC